MNSGPLYVRGANPIWYFVDLSGVQFDDTFYMWTLQNELPYLPQAVYKYPDSTPWTDPIQCLANGTFPDNIYFDPTLTYRLEFRKNLGLNPPSQNDPLIYEVNNFNPSGNGGGPIDVGGVFTENQISNAQFAEINFSSGYTLSATNPPPIEIAPDWLLTLSGTGTLAIDRVPLNSATPTPSNAPYALRLTMTGWSGNPVLSQKLDQNGVLWANKYVALAFTARVEGSNQNVTAQLIDSQGTILGVFSTDTITNSFTEFTGNLLLPASTNTDVPPDASITLKLALPATTDIYLTSFQLIASNTAVNIEYDQDTIERQMDHLFHYYNPLLQYMPIPSYLVGWDFPNNPAQWGETYTAAALGANKSDYIWDQTIVFSALTSGVSAARASSGALRLTSAASGTNNLAMVQYIGQAQARELLQGDMSVYLEGLTSNVDGLGGTVTLWYTKSTLPDIKPSSYLSLVSALDSTGFPTCGNGTWIQVERNNFGNATFTLGNSTTAFTNVSLSGWSLQAANAGDQNAATFMAIVVGFAPTAHNVTIDMLSGALCKGKIATRPAAQSPGSALLDCQQNYWKTFPQGVAPAQAVGIQTGEFIFPCVTKDTPILNVSSSIFYPVSMYANPSITYYNPVNANAQAYNETASSNAGALTTYINTKNSLVMTIPYGNNSGDILGVHIVADARFGTF
jgi:hypothetical protein